MKKTLALSAVLILGVLGAACPEPANNSNNTKPANNTAPANNTMTPVPVNTATAPANNTTAPANNTKANDMKNTNANNTKKDDK